MYLLGLVQTIGIAFFFWAGTNIVELKAENAASKATQTAMQTSIERVEKGVDEINRKLDRMRGR